MPALIVFIAFFILALLFSALLAYPAFIFLSNWFEVDFERVISRCVLIVIIITLPVLFKIFRFNSWQQIGYTTKQKDFWAQLFKGFALGVLIMLPIIIGLLITNTRVIDTDWNWSIHHIVGLLITAALSGLLIALIEETLFRGIMFTAIQKQASTLFAIISTSFIYAIVHFLQPEAYLAQNSINWTSGFNVVKNAFDPLLYPAQYFDSFIALFFAGVLLAMIKNNTNKLVICIGVHTGWVFAIKTFKRMTDTNIDSNFIYLVGSYDKVIGYLAAFCIILAIIIYTTLMNREKNN